MVPFEKKHKKIIKIPKKTFEKWLNFNVATGPIPETLFKILNVFLGNFVNFQKNNHKPLFL